MTVKRYFGIFAALMRCAWPVRLPSSESAEHLELDPEVIDDFLAKEVLLVGETHKKAQSYVLVQALLKRALDTRACIALAVEISSDQRKALDAVRAGVTTIDQIELWDALDFPPHRNFGYAQNVVGTLRAPTPCQPADTCLYIIIIYG